MKSKKSQEEKAKEFVDKLLDNGLKIAEREKTRL